MNTQNNPAAWLLSHLERPCCGTFKGSPHRATCPNYRGKFKAAQRGKEQEQ